MIDISEKRECFWDTYLIEKNEGMTLKQHEPRKCDIILHCDKPWEGNVSGYSQILTVGDKIYFYYRGNNLVLNEDMTVKTNKAAICVAISSDGGRTFVRPSLGIYEYEGSTDNNIVFIREKYVDNFTVIYDENPDCPADEKFKGLLGGDMIDDKTTLKYFKSPDGLRFEYAGVVDDSGKFDTLNTLFYDTEKKKYFLYFRGFHNIKTNDLWTGATRDIRVKCSDDFVNWSAPRMIEYDNDEDYEMYTNGIYKYPRADIFIGKGERYIDRVGDKVNFTYLPAASQRKRLIEKWDRSGTAMTDCVLMTSRDGIHFHRFDEAFLTPGPESEHNWFYGDCYASYRDIVTEDGITFFCGDNYRISDIDFYRYTLRTDGFISWNAPFSGARVLTKPVTLNAGKLFLNFSTSALGYVRLRVCDLEGNPVDGYDSGKLFGDSVNRPVDFDKELGALSGTPVRLLFELKDCDIYSMRTAK